MIKLNTGYSDYTDDDLQHLGESVAAKLATIAVFSTLKPTSTEIMAAVTDLVNARKMTGPGRAQAVNAAFDVLAHLLGEVAVNAPQVPNVTDTELAEIGLPIAKTAARATVPPPAPGNLRLAHGAMQGEITGKCNPVPGNIRSYEGQWALDPNGTDWSEVVVFSNSRSFHFTGLPRGKDVWVRARARNVIGSGAWSDPATIMVT